MEEVEDIKGGKYTGTSKDSEDVLVFKFYFIFLGKAMD